ncbi:MAG: WhiB family transcriptional regulator [Actinobacteria bacterium]|nr:WhiB family transcriptional regulator [Actinomycetota bacterium]
MGLRLTDRCTKVPPRCTQDSTNIATPECLDFALQAREVHGVWGGTSEEERRYLARSAGSSSRVSFRGLRTR